MKEKRFELYKRAESRGLTPEQEGRMQAELHDDGDHSVSPISEVDRKATAEDFQPVYKSVYPYSDLFHLQAMKQAVFQLLKFLNRFCLTSKTILKKNRVSPTICRI